MKGRAWLISSLESSSVLPVPTNLLQTTVDLSTCNWPVPAPGCSLELPKTYALGRNFWEYFSNSAYPVDRLKLVMQSLGKSQIRIAYRKKKLCECLLSPHFLIWKLISKLQHRSNWFLHSTLMPNIGRIYPQREKNQSWKMNKVMINKLWYMLSSH